MTFPVLRPLSVGEILDTSFGLYRRHFMSLATIVMISTGAPLLLNLYLQSAGGWFANPILGVVYLVCYIALSSLGAAATVFLISEGYLGRELSAGAALSRATPLLGNLIVYSILFALVVGIGLLLLVVPGIILACGLVLATPVIVLESGVSATGAMSRSWSLTQGSRMRMFGLLLVFVLLVYIPVIALTLVATMVAPGAFAAGEPAGTPMLIFTALLGIVQMVIYPLLYCILTVAYYDMRVRKEGFDLEMLASSLQPA
jgi:hypothetical protein